MMRTTPVPVIVVPAGYTHPAASPVEDPAEGGAHE
jgi:hypothetical protein